MGPRDERQPARRLLRAPGRGAPDARSGSDAGFGASRQAHPDRLHRLLPRRQSSDDALFRLQGRRGQPHALRRPGSRPASDHVELRVPRRRRDAHVGADRQGVGGAGRARSGRGVEAQDPAHSSRAPRARRGCRRRGRLPRWPRCRLHDGAGPQRGRRPRDGKLTATVRMAAPVVRAPRGAAISCKAWPQEAALRMLMNNLDAEVAEKPEDLIVYGGKGRAARSWDAFHAIVRSLRALESDETLLVQSGKPVGIAKTHPDAPRVLIANSLLVPAWARWDEFRRLEAKGLTMYGQMTAGSWIYIGTQGILQGTYETFAEAARQHFGGTLRGRWTLTAGLGGMGGAQPLAVTMNEGVCLAVEVDPERVRRRVETRYLDKSTNSLEEALRWVDDAVQKAEAVSIGLVAN